jgi:hypothetical protein
MQLNKLFYHYCSGLAKKGLLKTNLVTRGLVLGCLLAATGASAESKLELEETEITGARELPKILYIVPWKKAAPDPRPLPMRSLINEALTPIDMDVFRRQVRYHEMTQPSPEEAPPQQ